MNNENTYCDMKIVLIIDRVDYYNSYNRTNKLLE